MSGLPNRKMPKDTRISVCKRCGTGIFTHQSYTWQTRPQIGYVHTDCLPGSERA